MLLSHHILDRLHVQMLTEADNIINNKIKNARTSRVVIIIIIFIHVCPTMDSAFEPEIGGTFWAIPQSIKPLLVAVMGSSIT